MTLIMTSTTTMTTSNDGKDENNANSSNNQGAIIQTSSLEGLMGLVDSGIFGHRTGAVLLQPESKTLCSAWENPTIQFDEQGHVIALDLSSCRLRKGLPETTAATLSLPESFQRLSHLTTLNLGGTDLPVADTLQIVTAVANTLEALHIGGNSLGDTGATVIGKWLPMASQLIKLDLRYNDIGPVGCQALCNGLAEQQKVTKLYLEGNNLGEKGAMAVAELLLVTEQQPVETSTLLSTSNHQVDDATSTAQNTTTTTNHPTSCCRLKEVFLGGNQIGSDGATALANCLVTNKTLTKLYLEGNNIGLVGATAFTNALINCQGNTGLKHLFCDNNNIGKDGSKKLAQALNSATAMLGDSILEA